MAIPKAFAGHLSLPVVGAPMFIVSSPALVIAQCRAGILGCFPSLNARPEEELPRWIAEIRAALDTYQAAHPGAPVAPFGVNLIVNRANQRLAHDTEICIREKVPLIITSLQAPGDIVIAAHGYGGLVFHDVTTLRHAEKAAEHGVDGLILVSAGAGGHAGSLSPFALLAEVRRFFSGTILLAGAIGSGREVLAAQAMGADLAYMGTRFIATAEANASEGYKQMLVESAAKNVVYTPINGGPQTLTYNQNCTGGTGWHYDDPNKPTKIELCGTTCSGVQAASGSISIVMGCATNGVIPH